MTFRAAGWGAMTAASAPGHTPAAWGWVPAVRSPLTPTPRSENIDHRTLSASDPRGAVAVSAGNAQRALRVTRACDRAVTRPVNLR